MKKYLIILLYSMLFIMTSCHGEDENVENKNQINFQLIGKGNLIGNYVNPQNTIITNSIQWNNFLNQIDSTTHQTSASFITTYIDFNEFIAIIVVDEIYPSGGHSIDITKMEDHPKYITINVEKSLKENATSVLTQPYHIVKIPKTTKSLLFN
ncbi:protease complex subunit PrcB family protein [Chryseobacterium turcicum]|uniref:Protease complex subunit PrcB family protein n=1 Tax=Chryseobacterium turcicum TaxID=2898076 RepID=A0A9Q3V5U3_9FLAO|nr:protease complex subunit PrcB family protein [Chryseobacterium turcicum]MCD1118328.1 protease complex subunit PrcB family protein [Chryseobacterium turcicum]